MSQLSISSSTSHRPIDRTKQTDAATTIAAKSGGTMRSSLDRSKNRAGKQTTSPAGPSSGSLTESGPHALAKDEGRDTAHVNTISGENDTTATVAVISTVHVATYKSSGWR